MGQELVLQPHVQKEVDRNKSLQKRAVRLFARGGSIDTAQGYVVDVLRFSKWMGMTPEQLISSKYDWAAIP